MEQSYGNHYVKDLNADVAIADDHNHEHNTAEVKTSLQAGENITGAYTDAEVYKKDVMTVKESLLKKYNVQSFESGKLLCPECEKLFSSWTTLRDHCEYVHEGIKGTC